jgi:hypothetical protein
MSACERWWKAHSTTEEIFHARLHDTLSNRKKKLLEVLSISGEAPLREISS